MSESASPSSESDSSSGSGRGLMIGTWVARIVVVAIFLMGALPKFTGGATALDEVLPGPYAVLYLIAASELLAAVLILVPRTARIGAALAAAVMLGALGSHFVGPVGTSGDVGGMWPLALVALIAAAGSFVLLGKQPR